MFCFVYEETSIALKDWNIKELKVQVSVLFE